MALGKNIRRLRELRNETRPALARAIGIDSQQPIYALEKRDSTMSELAPRLAAHFDVDLQVLLEKDLANITNDQLEALRTSKNFPSDGSRISDLTSRLERTSPEMLTAVSDLLDLAPADAAKVIVLIRAFRGASTST